jgi:hypothetical protein
MALILKVRRGVYGVGCGRLPNEIFYYIIKYMAQITMENKIVEEVKILRHQVQRLQSAMIGIIGNDPEGEYRPKFVKEILYASQEKAEFTFTTKEAFIKQLDKI